MILTLMVPYHLLWQLISSTRAIWRQTESPFNFNLVRHLQLRPLLGQTAGPSSITYLSYQQVLTLMVPYHLLWQLISSTRAIWRQTESPFNFNLVRHLQLRPLLGQTAGPSSIITYLSYQQVLSCLSIMDIQHGVVVDDDVDGDAVEGGGAVRGIANYYAGRSYSIAHTYQTHTL